MVGLLTFFGFTVPYGGVEQVSRGPRQARFWLAGAETWGKADQTLRLQPPGYICTLIHNDVIISQIPLRAVSAHIPRRYADALPENNSPASSRMLLPACTACPALPCCGRCPVTTSIGR